MTSWPRYRIEIIGPYFVYGPTVIGKNYGSMLLYYAMAKIIDLPGSPDHQQHSASLPRAFDMRRHMATKLPQPWIPMEGPMAWPARSPSLTPLHFII